jgi:hypothetical protein
MRSILRVAEYTFTCDQCGKETTLRSGDGDVDELDDAISVLRSEGWSIGNQDLCPNCSGKG